MPHPNPSSCSSCGFVFEKPMKFCPECGADMNMLLRQQESVSENYTEESVSCGVCGDPGTIDEEVCRGCGAKLSGKPNMTQKVVAKQNGSPQPERQQPERQQQPKQIHNSQSHRKQNRQQETQFSKNREIAQKQFSSAQVMTIVVLAVIVVLVIAYAAGMFKNQSGTNNIQSAPLTLNNQPPNINLQGDPDNGKALAELEQRVKNNPNNLDDALQLAFGYHDTEQWTKAITLYEKYLAANPRNADVLVDCGICYFGLNEFAKADSLMQKALSVFPKHENAHFNLGIVNNAWGKPDVAKTWFQKYLVIAPNGELAGTAKEFLEKL